MTDSSNIIPIPRRSILSSPRTPVAMILAAAIVISISWARSMGDAGGVQQRNVTVLAAGLMTTLLCAVWLVTFAPLSRVVRRRLMMIGIVLLLAAAACLKIEGMTGDFWPIVRWRWAATPDRNLKPLEIAKQTPKEDPTSAATPTSPPAASSPQSSDFPQFLGPDRSGVIAGITLKRDWSASPPRLLWKRDIGAAWSGFAIAGTSAITQEQRGDDELVVCYDLATGQPRWSHADTTRYDTTIAGIGPRATPTIAGDRVFTLGATGILNCLDLATGKRHWTVDILADADAPQLDWGMTGSPLIEGELCIINTGGKLGAVAAYDTATGTRRWIAGEGATSYTSPCILTLHGTRQLVMQNQFTITGHALEDGRVLWSHDTPGGHPKVAQPLPIGENRLVVSSGYSQGSEAFELIKDATGAITTKSLWKNVYLKSKMSNLVLRDGHIYGFNDGTLTCLVAATGERAWRGERYGHGQLLLVGDVLLIVSEAGDVVLVEASPDDFRELARFTAFDVKTWNSPTQAGKYLLVRNDREAACYELP